MRACACVVSVVRAFDPQPFNHSPVSFILGVVFKTLPVTLRVDAGLFTRCNQIKTNKRNVTHWRSDQIAVGARRCYFNLLELNFAMAKCEKLRLFLYSGHRVEPSFPTFIINRGHSLRVGQLSGRPVLESKRACCLSDRPSLFRLPPAGVGGGERTTTCRRCSNHR